MTMGASTGKKSCVNFVQYESPLGYVIEDVRPHGGSKKYRSAVYSNVRFPKPLHTIADARHSVDAGYLKASISYCGDTLFSLQIEILWT